MNIGGMHHEFKDRSNRLESIDLLPFEIDSKLNDAQRIAVEHYSQLHQVAFEQTQQRVDMFSPLLYEEKVTTLEKVEDNVYRIDLSLLKFPYLHLASAFATCNDKRIKVAMVSQDELSYKLNDAFQKPSLKWGRFLGNIRRKQDQESFLYIYTDGAISEIRLAYIKRPKQMFFGGYDTAEYIFCTENRNENCSKYYDASHAPVNCELNEFYHNLIVDIAVWLTIGKTQNQFINSLMREKISLTT